MPKQDKHSLQSALQSRSPLAQRQAITPINILASEETTLPETPEPTIHTEKPNKIPERKKTTQKASTKTERKKRSPLPHTSSESENRTLLAPEPRTTVRDSYEASLDQLATIETLQALYHKKTGRSLSKSRVIREALAHFLPLALEAYQEEGK